MTRSELEKRCGSGFTLIELGMVMAVIAILSMAVLYMRGYREAAKNAAAMGTIDTLQKAAREWAARNNASQSFTGLTFAAMCGATGFVDCGAKTPWNDTPTIVTAADSTYFEITIDAHDAEAAADLYNSLKERAKGGYVTVSPPAGTVVTVTGR